MRKKILLMLSVFCFMGATLMAQTNEIEGGAGVIFVDGDPNDNPLLNDMSVNEGHVAYDRDNQVVYYYDPTGTDAVGPVPGPAVTGTHWIAVDVAGITDPITNILTPEDELDVSITGGVATITFDSDAAISYDNVTKVLTFTNVDGETSTMDFTLATDLVDIQAGNPSITVSGDGSSANPYLIELTGADLPANDGFVPVTDGTGALTWTNVVQSIAVQGDGTIDVTTTDGVVTTLDLSGIGEVANITELNAAAAALAAGEEGFVRAAENNTFGLTATSNVGVLFFISN